MIQFSNFMIIAFMNASKQSLNGIVKVGVVLLNVSKITEAAPLKFITTQPLVYFMRGDRSVSRLCAP